MDFGISGKRALLLAASGGLGKASALALSREGVSVAISSSNLERAQAAAAEITAETGNLAVGLLGDLANPANMAGLVAEAQAALGGHIDILLLNHGGPPMQSAMEVSQDVMVAQVNMMVLSQVAVAQALVPGMVARGWGRVFMVGASAVSQPIPNNVLSNMFRNALAQFLQDACKRGCEVRSYSQRRLAHDRADGSHPRHGGQKRCQEGRFARGRACRARGRFALRALWSP